MELEAPFGALVAAYTTWSVYRDGRWLARNWKRGAFCLGKAIRGFVGTSKTRSNRPLESKRDLQVEQQPSLPPALEPVKPIEPPKPPSFSELKPQAALDHINRAPKAERGALLAEAIRDGRLEIDFEGRPIVAGTKAKKKR